MIARLISDPMSVLMQLSSIPWWGMVWSTEPTKDIYRCDSLGERIGVISSGNNGVYFVPHVQKKKMVKTADLSIFCQTPYHSPFELPGLRFVQ